MEVVIHWSPHPPTPGQECKKRVAEVGEQLEEEAKREEEAKEAKKRPPPPAKPPPPPPPPSSDEESQSSRERERRNVEKTEFERTRWGSGWLD